MNVLILGGMSKHHKEWIRCVAEDIQPHFSKIEFLDYSHWYQEGHMDLEYEVT